MNTSHQNTPAEQAAPALLKKDALKKQPRWKTVVQDTFGEYGYLLVAALIPAVLFYLIYLLGRGHHPFGDGTVLVLDLNGQYVSFYEGLYSILHGEADLLYSFSRNLGGEFLGIYDYYVASPFAMLIALLPREFMLHSLLLLFLLKAALCAFNMGIYLHKHSAGEPNRLVVVTFSVMYAMSSYCVVQQHNSMWIDAVLWLPLLALGIESLIKYGRFRLYVFALAITIHSNFYIGYMAVLFTLAYCFFYYFAHNRNNENNPLGEKNHFIKSVGRVAAWSVLAVGIAAMAILSARYALTFGKDEFSKTNWEVTQKFDLLEFFYKFLPFSYDTVRPSGRPFVYCGVLTLITVPAFFLNKKFSMREKVASALLILFFVASFATSSIDLIWHGFQKPNWLNYRYSFMLCFFLLTLGYRAFDQILYSSRKALLGISVGLGSLILVLYNMRDFLFTAVKDEFENKDKTFDFHPFGTVWLAIGCIFVYFILTSLYGKVKARKKEIVTLILLLAVCTEVFVSGLSDIDHLNRDVTFSKYSKYKDMTNTVRPITETIREHDDGFYRMETTYFRKTNDSFALQMRGLSCSTSTLNRDTIDYLRSMGYASKSHWSRYLGGTPVNDGLLGIRYLITDKDNSQYYGAPLFTPEDYGYDEDFQPNGQYNVYYNEYALSLAYGVANGWLGFDYEEYDCVFDRLNAMITVMLGETETVEVFKPAVQNGDPEMENLTTYPASGYTSYKIEDSSETATLKYHYTVPADTELFFYYPTGIYTREVKLAVNDKAPSGYNGKGTFGGGETNRIVSLGKSTTGDLYLKVTVEEKLFIRPKDSYVYYIDMDVYKDAFSRLGKTQFIIDSESTDSHLTGTVTTETDSQLMFTSIPYDEGWKIYVDGKRVETFEANNALISFYVDGAGEHTVEMKYMPATVALGITVSLTCLILYILILIAYPFIKKVPYLRKLVMIEGEELPEIASAEYMAEIEEGDIGAPDRAPTAEDLIAEAEAAKYGQDPNRKAPPAPKGKTSPAGGKANAPKSQKHQSNPKGGKK